MIEGSLVALSGAFIWAFLFIVWEGGGPYYRWIDTGLWSGYAVLVSSWFVIPIGALLGVLVPQVAQGHRCIGGVVKTGTFIGVLTGIMVATLALTMEEWPMLMGRTTIVDELVWSQSVWRRYLEFLATMIPVCALWVATWSSLRWRMPPFAPRAGKLQDKNN